MYPATHEHALHHPPRPLSALPYRGLPGKALVNGRGAADHGADRDNPQYRHINQSDVLTGFCTTSVQFNRPAPARRSAAWYSLLSVGIIIPSWTHTAKLKS